MIENNPDYIDLYLMSKCSGSIIANSSFSWWGAYLINNPEKKIVAPRNWIGPGAKINTKDLITDGWMVL